MLNNEIKGDGVTVQPSHPHAGLELGAAPPTIFCSKTHFLEEQESVVEL
jgi:hypothetical protein